MRICPEANRQALELQENGLKLLGNLVLDQPRCASLALELHAADVALAAMSNHLTKYEDDDTLDAQQDLLQSAMICLILDRPSLIGDDPPMKARAVSAIIATMREHADSRRLQTSGLMNLLMFAGVLCGSDKVSECVWLAFILGGGVRVITEAVRRYASSGDDEVLQNAMKCLEYLSTKNALVLDMCKCDVMTVLETVMRQRKGRVDQKLRDLSGKLQKAVLDWHQKIVDVKSADDLVRGLTDERVILVLLKDPETIGQIFDEVSAKGIELSAVTMTEQSLTLLCGPSFAYSECKCQFLLMHAASKVCFAIVPPEKVDLASKDAKAVVADVELGAQRFLLSQEMRNGKAS